MGEPILARGEFCPDNRFGDDDDDMIMNIMKTTMMKMMTMALDKSNKVLTNPQYCVPHCWEYE